MYYLPIYIHIYISIYISSTFPSTQPHVPTCRPRAEPTATLRATVEAVQALQHVHGQLFKETFSAGPEGVAIVFARGPEFFKGLQVSSLSALFFHLLWPGLRPLDAPTGVRHRPCTLPNPGASLLIACLIACCVRAPASANHVAATNSLGLGQPWRGHPTPQAELSGRAAALGLPQELQDRIGLSSLFDGVTSLAASEGGLQGGPVASPGPAPGAADQRGDNVRRRVGVALAGLDRLLVEMRAVRPPPHQLIGQARAAREALEAVDPAHQQFDLEKRLVAVNALEGALRRLQEKVGRESGGVGRGR
jgi:hypothetical protein